MTDNKWFLVPQPQPLAQKKLFCLHYAGAGASAYRLWPRALPPAIEVLLVQMPGRESRRTEPLEVYFEPVAEQIANVISEQLDNSLDANGNHLPFAVFGHSMGAMMAYEVTCRLIEKEKIPEHLFVSAFRAPHLPPPDDPIHQLPNDEMVDVMQTRYGGIPKIILETPDVLELFLPVMRADMQMIETYSYETKPALNIPISAFGGRIDKRVKESDLKDWEQHTTKEFKLQMFPGGHFYLQDRVNDLTRIISRSLGI